jgi:hypothetical protein
MGPRRGDINKENIFGQYEKARNVLTFLDNLILNVKSMRMSEAVISSFDLYILKAL